ncbi:manganese transport protein MntH [Fusobacterium polymorphum]|uniref:Possible Nramp family metal ion transporter n=1 Tax=Fusobacterium polymorphum ATCC 10953 TaxID=393480 RepID=A5TX09_FUSNP|nr:NRAMP family divalent metal transporter [Fusobacterium polymorphum]EDK89434.1 possible Nramp family metal ion transporter [Fusobacterium polymorphum ATCC 10953]UTI52635.1 divalent metal cation transporter [Fusobacterium polymorphum]WRL69375.1 NRAMP family divalent metal transporter [Fusobacterium polymorphum]CKH09331.1 manganese transport protein MntH [Fusobacterium polymorphum]
MEKKNNLSVLLGAAFLMATSAIGPGFMTQTAVFTKDMGATFAFVILVSVIMSFVAQLNVWRVLAVSKMRGQDIANSVLPGLGYFITFLVCLGGLAFNIGNVGGAALGFQVLFDLDLKIAALVSGALGVIIFSFKSASKLMDKLTQVLGAMMILLIGYVAFSTNPPVGTAVKETFIPSSINLMAIITLIGGTVGGYIMFSGGHRLIDAGIVGEENLPQVNKSAILGMSVATIVRIFLFLAVLGVVSLGNQLDAGNPAADAFKIAAGTVGYKIFGLVFLAAALTSIVGAAYTSVSFLKTLFKVVKDYENLFIIGFIVVSTLILIFLGKPVKLLVLAGSLNGLILPITLAITLIASKKEGIVGKYKHSNILFLLGWVVVLVTAYIGVQSLSKLAELFA